jgi:hypothetical protein
MREHRAKKHLQIMLRSFTPGSVLTLLADLYRETAEDARRDNDESAYRQCRLVESALVVVGLGIDAACPH